jgi:uncharacterized protein YlxW (UPF0749 family)
MNAYEMVVLIVGIVMIASVARARMGGGRRHGRERPETAAENRRLQAEVSALHQRIAVLERITVEKENSLEREIEQLRDR